MIEAKIIKFILSMSVAAGAYILLIAVLSTMANRPDPHEGTNSDLLE